MTDLFLKKRNEYWVLNGMRISYSLDDILIEDFIDQKNHPYAIYDFNGNILETNVTEGTFAIDYNNHADFLKYIIGKYGMD